MIKIFLKTNAQGKSELRTWARQDPHQDSWMLLHMIAQIARFGLMDIKIKGMEDNPVALAKSLGRSIGKEVKKAIIRNRNASLFLWPFEQSLSIVRIAFPAKPYALVQTDIPDPQQKRMLEEFYKEFAKEANIGITAYSIDTGRFSQKARKGMMYNAHHQFEGLGKAFGRTLRDLTRKTPFLLPSKIQKQDKRISQETTIESRWGFRGTGKTKIDIGAKRDPSDVIKVLQEGLKAFGKAGKFDLSIKARGDDEHHLYEDLAIVLGNLLNQLLDQRKGIVRTAWSIQPIRGALVLLAADLGRGYCHIETDIKNQAIQSMMHHYFESFSRFGKLDIVAFGIGKNHPFMRYLKSFLPLILSQPDVKRVHAGTLQDKSLSNALFKALGKSLKEAIKIDPARTQEIPSTKGIID